MLTCTVYWLKFLLRGEMITFSKTNSASWVNVWNNNNKELQLHGDELEKAMKKYGTSLHLNFNKVKVIIIIFI